jgi:8-oxo-dGTP pyrophosphatase MutT (NUDIX family)
LGALRELREETGIVLKKTEYILGHYSSHAEGKQDTVIIVVAKTTNTIIPKLEIEIQKAQWFPFDQLPITTTYPTLWRIHEYLTGKKDVQGFWAEPAI